MNKLVNGELVPMTKTEIRERQAEEAAFAAQRSEYIAWEKYKDDRAKEYPSLADQLDAIWKQLNAYRLAGDPLIQEADAMLNQILAIKQRYPKPEKQKP